jgi:hypothetical protein
MRDSDGQPLKDERGKLRYRSPIRWSSRDLQNRFSEALFALVESSEGGAVEPRRETASGEQQKLPGVGASSRRQPGLYARHRRAEAGRDLPDDGVADLWPPDAGLVS